jgi:predicted alpha/beta hydrolase family esterase
LWEARYPNLRRVEQRNWERPTRNAWIDAIDHDVLDADESVFAVAHSLGCLAVAHWAASRDARRMSGALLVAPPWLTHSANCPSQLADFLPTPLHRLPFPSILVASENDPYLPIEVAIRLAKTWGSEFVNVGCQGHINVASGHGRWPAGERLLEQLISNSIADSEIGALAERIS